MTRPLSFFSSPRVAQKGFTLLEMLVATAVLVLLIVMVAQLTNSATLTITGCRKRIDADSQARMIFDRMARDFAGMVKRADVNYLFAKPALSESTGNDTMYFYSEAPAYASATISGSSKTSVALVGYRINSKYQLERLGMGLTWDGVANAGNASSEAGQPGGMVFLSGTVGTLAETWPNTLKAFPYSSGTSVNYHVLADQVYRMEICFQLKDGSYCNAPSLAPSPRYFDDGSLFGLPSDLSAIIVSIAILDNTSRQMVSDLKNFLGVFPDSNPQGATSATRFTELPAACWQKKMAADCKLARNAGIPQAAASQIRVYQRFFYLNTK